MVDYDIEYTLNGGNGQTQSWGIGNSWMVRTGAEIGPNNEPLKLVIDCGIDRTNDPSLDISGDNTFDLREQLKGAHYFIFTQAASDHMDGLVALLAQGDLTRDELPKIILGEYASAVLYEKLEAAGFPGNYLDRKIDLDLEHGRAIHLGELNNSTTITPLSSPHSLPGVFALLIQHGESSMLLSSDTRASASISSDPINTQFINYLCEPYGLTLFAADAHAVHENRASVPDDVIFQQFKKDLAKAEGKRIVFVSFSGYADLSIMAARLAAESDRTLVYAGQRNDLYFGPIALKEFTGVVPVDRLDGAGDLPPEKTIVLTDNILDADGKLPGGITLGPDDVVFTPYRHYGMNQVNPMIDASGATRFGGDGHGNDIHDGHMTLLDLGKMSADLDPAVIVPIHARPNNRVIAVNFLRGLADPSAPGGRLLNRLDLDRGLIDISNGAVITIKDGKLLKVERGAPIKRIAVRPTSAPIETLRK